MPSVNLGAMKRRDIVIGLVVLAVLVGIIYWVRRPGKEGPKLPTTPSLEEQIEESFNLQIPEDVEKAELKDVYDGDSTGLATRKYESGKFTHAVLADLPEPASGKFYEGWLVKGDEVISTGKLTIAKGGYLLEFESGMDYSDYNDVVVTQEAVDDNTPEEHILEGTF